MKIDFESVKLAVIGQGYVGLPLAVEFGKKFKTIGFDISSNRIKELKNGVDSTLEVSKQELCESSFITFSDNLDDIKSCNIYIVTVPTPIDEYKKPDLSPLISASKMLGSVIKKNDVVIFESTVYPGATEDDCIPVIEQVSGLKFNEDFFAGYSPERINPGDKEHRVVNIKKVTSGSTAKIAQYVDALYNTIIEAGTHLAPSIKVAEAAKVIENTQRDVNIALINELALIFNRLDIDTLEVLEAAGTKWNFLPFRPGLVGGHCIGVDPYYLTHKAQSIGYNPEMILAGRRLNDNMGSYIASQLIKEMIKKGIHLRGANVLVKGLTFKENCPDLRNTKVIDIINELKEYNLSIDVFDPWCCKKEAKHEYAIDLIEGPEQGKYDAIIIAVAHDEFKELPEDVMTSYCKSSHVVYDLKYVLEKGQVDIRL
jgi:UDP-N-acetyl-D-galactosamine dehydrogenase